MIDVYSVGILIMFMVCGSYQWTSTREISSIFEQKMLAAESIIDLISLRALKNTISKCLLLDPSVEPVDRISELLQPLKAAKENCEKILK